MCFVILVSVIAVMSNTLFLHLRRTRSSKFFFKEHPLRWNKATDLCLQILKFDFDQCHSYLELETFSGSLFFLE